MKIETIPFLGKVKLINKFDKNLVLGLSSIKNAEKQCKQKNINIVNNFPYFIFFWKNRLFYI